MAEFSKQSLAQLETCHIDLQRLFNEVIKNHDCSILCGYRGREEQERAVKAGNSKLHYPASSHNKLPALAVDVAPYPVNWKDRAGFIGFAYEVLGVAKMMGIKVRWGGAWNGTRNKPGKFDDLPHFELMK
jgi:peptidoglycan L-alanyl-D-glutamate endopeptidase CwlK